MVTRPADALNVIVLSAAAQPFLEACAAGSTLGEAASAVVPENLAAIFAALLSAGALA